MGYIYVKHEAKVSTPRPKIKIDLKYKKIVASSLMVIGVLFFLSAIVPILQYQIEYSIKFNQVLSPLSSGFANSGSILGESGTDFTQLSNWFVNDASGLSEGSVNKKPQYTISIPKLKMDSAIVEVGSLDLKKSLIQYPQTALPGQFGSAVIFGHSVLPQFYSPKSYMTIFSTLYTLKQGDDIIVNFDNVEYKYLVEEMFEVLPTNLSILEQSFDGRYLTLVTCTPPGTYLRRLVVKARIVDF
ncbi:MAG: sortase [Candidatus Shapirobacteria bacterium]